MRVIYCYTKVEDRSFAALKKFAPQAELVDTSGSIYDYNEAIASRWTGESDLVVIEGDKEITADVLPSFANCESYWCSYAYLIFPKIIEREVEIGLGCARFSAKLQRLINPNEFLCEDPTYIFGAACDICFGKGCWKFLDARIADAIRGHGINVCCHGRIDHFHGYPSELMEDSATIAKTQLEQAKAFDNNPETHRWALELAGPNWVGR